MTFGEFFLRIFYSKNSRENSQSATITGNNNNIYQTISYNYAPSEEIRSEWEAPNSESIHATSQLSVDLDSSENEESDEVKRILEYRKISAEGDSTTALKLLDALTTDKKYASGYPAFRLFFNIGVIQQNIGDLDQASSSLRRAYNYFPEDKKAQAGLAWAEFIDGNDEGAFEKSKSLLEFSGDHQNLAAVVALHAARKLKIYLRLEEYSIQEPYASDVIAAHLEYLSAVEPERWSATLNDAFKVDPGNEVVASQWALSVLDDIKQNQAFLLGAKMPEDFEEQVKTSSEILRKDLEDSLGQRPPNKLLLPSQANNAAVALRLAGRISEATKLIERTIQEHPYLAEGLAQLRAVLLLQEDKDNDALEAIKPFTNQAELQLMASEIEAKIGRHEEALNRVNSLLKSLIVDELRIRALSVKAHIGISYSNREAADEAIEDMSIVLDASPELVLLKAAYNRAFEIQNEIKDSGAASSEEDVELEKEQALLSSLKNVEGWNFYQIFQASNELFARQYYRECSDLLRDRVSYSKESPALRTLCDACLRGRLGTLAEEISVNFAPEIKNSVFGWKFDTEVGYLNGNIIKTIPLARNLFEQNRDSIGALQLYVRSLLRLGDKNRIIRIIKSVNDSNLFGTILEQQEYVNLLVYCGEIERARSYAYRLFCQNPNDHRAWIALSSSVLAYGRPSGVSDDLTISEVMVNSAFEVLRPDGNKQIYVVEEDPQLFPLRAENIRENHPISQSAMGKHEGECFVWPFSDTGEVASIISIKHKALEAFHFVLQRFEEQFPDASGFKSCNISISSESGLDELKSMLQQRAEYAQQKAKEYNIGSFPIYILGFYLGIDSIDAFLGLKSECGFAVKVSSCEGVDQEDADAALAAAKDRGIIADPICCYLLRRLNLENIVEKAFGQIGVTQSTIDMFSQRLQDAENMGYHDPDTGTTHARSISVRNGQIFLSEISGGQLDEKLELLRNDLKWLQSRCKLVSSVAKTDPDDSIIRFRDSKGGWFFNDVFAADGSGRVLLSEDYYVRSWGKRFFEIKSAWMQSLLFYLEYNNYITIQETVKATAQLCVIGEEALSINVARILSATEMRAASELTEAEFIALISIIGQKGADIKSHVEVSVLVIFVLWNNIDFEFDKRRVTGLILRSLTRNRTEDASIVIDTVVKSLPYRNIIEYISSWRMGHFL